MNMKKFAFLVVMIIFTLSSWAQTSTPPSNGDGSSGNPYQIATLNNLYWLSQNSSEWDKHYVQTADIDASATSTWNLGDHDNNAGTPDEYMGFSPIGNLTNKFSGTFDGQGYTIDGLTINRPTQNNVGLFGSCLLAADFLKNIHLQNISIKGYEKVGGISGLVIGYSNSEISNCSVTGEITQVYQTLGGLVGELSGSISILNCTANVSLNSNSAVGGLVGYLSTTSTISNSFCEGTVTGNSSNGFNSGGLVAQNYGRIENCYCTVDIIGAKYYAGGLVANNMSSGLVENCYYNGSFTPGYNYSGGLVGENSGTVSNSFWDTETSGQLISAGGTGKTTAEMTTPSTYTDAGWDFEAETANGTDDFWGMYSYYNSGYPILLGVTPKSLAVVTNAATNRTTNGATLNGNIPTYGEAGLTPTQHGFVWSTNPNPTLDDNKSEQGTPATTGAYTYSLTGLTSLTTYYVRAYATNTDGTTYGNEISFSTTPEGSGTGADPYLVPDLATLRWLSENQSFWDKHFLQTADIDASETADWNLGNHDNDDGTADEPMGFSPIGNIAFPFEGYYDGSGFIISSLTINRPGYDTIGFFGSAIGAGINNLGLTHINVSGISYVGGLIGEMTNDTISNCFTSGSIYGKRDYTGGLVGCAKSSSITNSFSNVDVRNDATVTYHVGGLVGSTKESTILIKTFSSGNVMANGSGVGGLVGGNYSKSTISNSYSTSKVSGYTYIGGLVGINNSGSIINSYSKGFITYSVSAGGLVGYNFGGTISNSFWDTQTSGQSSSPGGTGKNTTEMTTQSSFTDAGWDFEGESTNGTDDYWGIYSYYNNGYPIILDVTPQPVAVATNEPTNLTSSSATLNGEILSLGDGTSTQHGFVWSTSTNPTLNDDKSEQGAPSSTGAYTYSLTGLMPDVTYYVKAYATDTEGTVYAEEVSFTTSASTEAYYIDYNIRTDDFYAETNESGIFQGYADPVWRFRSQVGGSYSSGGWSDWECFYDVPGSQAYGNGAWLNEPTVERWSGTVLSNADNIYIGIEGWEDEDQNLCTYNSGTDEKYSSDYDYQTNLNGTVSRATWEDFRNAQQINVDYVDCGTSSNDDYFKIAFDVWWDYSIPVDPQFSLSDATTDGFSISITGYNNYRVTSWDYEISDDAGFSNIVATAAGVAYSTLDISGLNSGTTYYVRISGTNEAGTGNYSPSQSINTIGVNIWDGSENTDWHTADNWSLAVVPTTDHNVIIPSGLSNYPTLSEAAFCNDLTIESSSVSTGSLIGQSNLTVNGTVIIQRYVTGGVADGGTWHLISSPVDGQGINDFVIANTDNAVATNAPKYGLAPYDKTVLLQAQVISLRVKVTKFYEAQMEYFLLQELLPRVMFQLVLQLQLQKNLGTWWVTPTLRHFVPIHQHVQPITSFL